MSLSVGIGIFALILLVWILLFLWRLVSSPLPLEMQEALEKKTEAKLAVLKEEWSARLSEEMKRVWMQFQEQVRTTESSVSQKLQQANETFAKVTQELGRVQKATEQVEAVGRNVASLQELLRAPKLRGGLGEFFLADLLAQILPGDFFTLQYEFSGGERVDAVIRLGDQLVPVDSKFPLEQFRNLQQAVTDEERLRARKELIRDVKQHINAISDKYIRPTEGTFDFALMYIPAESVYYETIIREDGETGLKSIFEHAIERRVIPVSPNSFYAYLQVILFGLRGLKVEHQAREILAGLNQLNRELSNVREDFNKTGKHLRNALDSFERSDKRLDRFEGRLESVEMTKTESPALIQKEKQPVEEV